MDRKEAMATGEFDFDGEQKYFRKTLGLVAILVGILFLIFNTYMFSKVLRVMIGGESIKADIVRGRVYTVAEYNDGDKTYRYDIRQVFIRDNQKTITLYYKGDIEEAIPINWITYGFSYVVYFVILGLGIMGRKNIGIKDLIKMIIDYIKKKDKERNHWENA